MAIYLKWQTTQPDTADRFTANLFSNISKRWYPVNIIGSNLYDVLSMYGTEFSSGSSELTQVFNDLNIESVREGVIFGHTWNKMYENFGVMVNASKLPFQEFSTFNTGSVLNSYREMLKFLNLAHTEGSTPDALRRIGQALNCVSPVIIEPINNYPGWVLSNYSGSVYANMSIADAKKQYVVVTPDFGRFGNVIPITTGSNVPTGSNVSLSYSVLGLNTILSSKQMYESGVYLYFFYASGSMPGGEAAIQSFITNQVSRLLPANIQPYIMYSQDFVLWKPVGLLQDTMVSGSNVWAINHNGWIYNASPTNYTGSIYQTDVIQLPA